MTTPLSVPDYSADSAYAWRRLGVSLVLSTVGGIGLWSAVVALPAIETEFGVDRSQASLPYLATMIGYATGGVLIGRFVDRFGIMPAILGGALMLCIGYVAASQATSLWQFTFAQAVLIGMCGSAATFGPLVGEVSLWFQKRRGIAVSIVACGTYLSGTIWPPLLQYAIETLGWREAHMWVGILCVTIMFPLALLLRRRAPLEDARAAAASARGQASAPLSPSRLQALLVLAGISCCVAMAMPQVHIVAYCGDLGYGAQRGAEMLSVMLGTGVISRLASGMIIDRIGGIGTLILGSTLQCLALMFYLPFDGLASLYVVSALFGLSQGGIVPSYAIIVREYFPAREAATRISMVLMATSAGMALGGWMSGEIYDLTGSYQAAFLNGIAFNLVNMSIAFWLLMGRRRMRRTAI